MAQLVAAAATSHAFALREPDGWDAGRIGNQQSFERKFGYPPETPAEVAQETDEDVARRYAFVRSGHDTIVQRFEALNLDALVILGNDQDEEFTEQSIAPQLAIYTGKEFSTRSGAKFAGQPELAYHLLSHTVNAGFDVTRFDERHLQDGVLKAHAFGPVLERVTPKFDVRVVPVYVESFRLPCPSPARCYAFGQSLAEAIETWPGNGRIAVVASGGISHFPQSFPFQYAPDSPQAKHGNVDHVYDRQLFDLMAQGRNRELAALTNQDLLDHGDTELHSWITLLGMVGDTKAEVLAYEPFFRAIMAMGVAYWDLEPALAR